MSTWTGASSESHPFSSPAMSLLIFLFTFVLIIATTVVILRRIFQQAAAHHRRVLLSTLSKDKDTQIAGFLHPYCNAGGGGERVLFAAISYLQTSEPQLLSIVYTGDVDSNGRPLAKSEILKRCKERFGIDLDKGKVEFIHLKWRWLVEDSTWKRFTMLGQGLGAALLGAEAMWRLVPDVFLGALKLCLILSSLTHNRHPRAGILLPSRAFS